MKPYSPYIVFPRESWREFRKDTPLTLTQAELGKLHGQLQAVSLEEVSDIYLPLSRLLNLYVAATQELYRVTGKFLGNPEPKVPYIIGVAGSVAVGKSTTSRILQALLSRWPHHPRVELITTDGFLFPNAVLEERGLLNRKGFPESYDLRQLIDFLFDLKSGKPNLRVPLYSHHHYDILSDQYQLINQPDIVIVEGLNVLQVASFKPEQQTRVFVSDFFDFTIYVDAKIEIIRQWFMQRFMLFREKAKTTTEDFFYQFTKMSEKEAMAFAEQIWQDINAANLCENILPFKERAKLILEKAADHSIQNVYLRKL
jgi:type I pantothenate kinase